MTIVRIQKIFCSQKTIEHFGKHSVSYHEVESVIQSDCLVLEGYSGKKILLNKVGSRLISVIVDMVGNKLIVKTARDSSQKERKIYYEQNTT